MSRPHLRPHFDMLVDAPPDAVVERLRCALRHPTTPYTGAAARRHAQLQPKSAHRHLWSPWLSFEIGAEGDRTRLQGRFTPHPNVWTFFLALHATAIFLGLGSGIFALVQHSLGESPWGWWVFAAAVALGAAATFTAWLGPGLGAEDMLHMSRFVERVAEHGLLEGVDDALECRDAPAPFPGRAAPSAPANSVAAERDRVGT